MKLIEQFVRNPIKVSVGVLLVALFGVIALFDMPMQLTPEVQIPMLTITTRWPGRSPQDVEREIVMEQEEQLRGVEGLRKMRSESSDSFAMINLEFEIGTEMNEALLKVNSRLQQVPEYPEDADEPVISTSNSADRPIAWFRLRSWVPEANDVAAFQREHPELADALEPVRTAHVVDLRALRLRRLVESRPDLKGTLKPLLSPDIDVLQYRKFAEDFIESRFERVEGVSESNVLGGREPEMQVILDPQQLAARQLTIANVREALRRQNVDTSGGDVWEGKRRYVVRTLGQFRSPEQVANTILARRDGAPVYVRDVAEVRLGYKKPEGMTRGFDVTGLSINVMRANGANVFDVMTGLRREMAALNQGILKQQGLRLDQVYDETEYISSAIGLVNDNIVVGGILTVAVLLLFLRSARSTLVVALAIPTSLIGTFLMLDLMNRSLNVISLAGLAFAVGMLVDNAIVVLENIYRRYQLGEDRVTATVRGAQEVWGAVVASTLTTLAVFLPVLFVQDTAGQLFRDIALAISCSVGLSMVVSIIVIPAATAKILSREDHAETAHRRHNRLLATLLRPVDVFSHGFVRSVAGINAWTQRSVSRSLLMAGLLIGIPCALTYALLPKVEYLPNGNRNLVIARLLPPPGYNVEQLTAMGDRMGLKLIKYWDVDPEGPEAAGLDYPVIGDFFFIARPGEVFMGLRAYRPLEAAQLVELLRKVSEGMPGTIAVVNQTSLFGRGLSGSRTIDVEITGPELTRLVDLGGRIMGQVREILDNDEHQLQMRPQPSLDLSSPEAHAVPKSEQARDMEFYNDELGYAVDALVDGAKATDYYYGGDKIDLTIVGRGDLAQRTQDLAGLPVATPGGQLVPLAAVAEVVLSSGPEQIHRRERQRAITIEVTPPRGVPLQEAMDRIQQQIVAPLRDNGELGSEYQINLSGTADDLRRAWEALRFNFLLALLITYLLMAALFESWLYPLVIILTVPLGAVGGFIGLWLLNFFTLQPLDVLTMLGFVILIGTVVNNPILIVHQSLNHMREDRMTPAAAIVESVRTRMRPIFMTTLTTVLGLMPLVFLPGAGSELYRGLGAVVLGGLLISTIFTLILVPTVFGLSMRARTWFVGLVRRMRARRAEERSDETIEPAPASAEAPFDGNLLPAADSAGRGNGQPVESEQAASAQETAAPSAAAPNNGDQPNGEPAAQDRSDRTLEVS